jgi:mono/diheme cytochrome c family protein
MAPDLPIRCVVVLIVLAFATGCRSGVAVPAEILASPTAREAGAGLFAANCAICHGGSGNGRGMRRAGFDVAPPNFRTRAWRDGTSPGRIFETIRTGKKPSSMPAWPGLEDAEVYALVAYLWSLSEMSGR